MIRGLPGRSRRADLLCHRSGLPAQVGDLLEDMGYGRMEILRRLRYVKPATSFRSDFAYTNFGFTAAAIAAGVGVRQALGGSCRSQPLSSARHEVFEFPLQGL